MSEDPMDVMVEETTIELDYTNVMVDAIGPDHGLSRDDLRGVAPRLEELITDLQRSRHQGRPEFLDLPLRRDWSEQARSLLSTLDGMENVVLLGIGGSALGAKAILEAAWGPLHLETAGRPGGPPRRVFVADNIDPDGFAQILELCDLRTTLFNVVSKSGSTVEVLSQLAIVWRLLGEKLGEKERTRHLVFTTDPTTGFLREMAEREKIPALDVPEGVGGRYSVLTPVGLFPALAAGIEPEELLEGASLIDEACRSPKLRENPAALLAAVHYLMDRRKGKTVTVLMPYSDRLRSFGDWFCQLWAESLGKSRSRGGEDRSPVGQTTVRASGVTDQHSQAQLFLEGPNDKVITFIRPERTRADFHLAAPGVTAQGSPLSFLEAHSLGEVLRTEAVATEMALARAERPNLTWHIDAVTPRTLGQLFFVYEVACVLAGGLYHVNPYDQPGVEEGKGLAYGALGRPGWERQREEMVQYRERGSGYRV